MPGALCEPSPCARSQCETPHRRRRCRREGMDRCHPGRRHRRGGGVVRCGCGASGPGGQDFHLGPSFRRLACDVRSIGQPDRRGDRLHARSHPFSAVDAGRAAGLACVLPEAADPHDLGGPRVDPGRAGCRCGHPDGQPGDVAGGGPAGRRVGEGRRAGLGAGDPLLDRSSGPLVAAGRAAPHRSPGRSPRPVVGPVARDGSATALSSGLGSLQVARVVGFRHGGRG